MADRVVKLYNGTVTIEFFEKWKNPETGGTCRHVYLVNGVRCEHSVTGALEQINKPQLIVWAVDLLRDHILLNLENGNTITEELVVEGSKLHLVHKKQAADLGTLVHQWAEACIKGLNPPMPEDPRVAQGVIGFLNWTKQHGGVRFVTSEKMVYSKRYGYIGTLDVSFTFGDENHEILHPGDFKTGNGIYDEARFQVSGYAEADAEESGIVYGDAWILRFIKEDKYDKKTGELKHKAGTCETLCIPASERAADFEAFLGALAIDKRKKALEKLKD